MAAVDKEWDTCPDLDAAGGIMETLDTTTLRVVFAVVAVTLLGLFYFVTFQRTRSIYSAWWCAALALFLTHTKHCP